MRPAIFTIGYARTTQEALLSALREAKVTLLADVRALPLSRRPGFSKTSLAAAVEQAGIIYRHFRHLGTPKEGRDAARSGNFATMRRIYAGQLALPEALAQLAELRSLAHEQATCLLCYCEEADECHRSELVTAVFTDFERVDLLPLLQSA